MVFYLVVADGNEVIVRVLVIMIYNEFLINIGYY